MGSRSNSKSSQRETQGPIRKGLGLLLLLSMVAWGNFAMGTLEICRHSDGETHLFFSGGSCAGLHVEGDNHSHVHGHTDDAHDCGDNHHEDHHEPCDHEAYSLEHDWSLSGSRTALVSPASFLTLPAGQTISAFAPNDRAILRSNGLSRAPPWRAGNTLIYLRTIRLLI